MQIESKFFNTRATNLNGDFTGETISRQDFMREAGRHLVEIQGKVDDFAEALWDYSRTLCAITKEELLDQMRNRIDHIDTFYHI